MNRIKAFILSFSFIVVSCVFACVILSKNDLLINTQPSDDDFTVIIDAGHGGMDGGTSAADGTVEKDINLSISKKLHYMLSAVGLKSVMLRTDDSLIGDNTLSTIRERKVSDIKTRLSIAQSYSDAVMISVHQNHFSVPKYKGAQVFYSKNNVKSKILALEVQNGIVLNLQNDNTRQIKEVGSNIYLLYNCNLPSIMVECGFLSNPAEAELLKNNNYQKLMAFSIMQGILNYLE